MILPEASGARIFIMLLHVFDAFMPPLFFFLKIRRFHERMSRVEFGM